MEMLDRGGGSMASRKLGALQVLVALFYGLATFALYSADGGFVGSSLSWYASFTLLWLISAVVIFKPTNARPSLPGDLLYELVGKITLVSPMLVWRVDGRGTVREILGRVQNGPNVDKGRYLDKSIRVLNEDAPGFYQQLQRALTTHQPFSEACEFNQRLYRHHFLPFFDDQGMRQGFHCISVDISREEEIDSRARMAEQVFANTADAVVILDRARRVASVNRAFNKITGFKTEEVVGTQNSLALWSEQAEEFYADAFGNLAELDAWHGEITGRRKSGELFPANMALSAIRDDLGALVNYVVFFSDLSHVKRKQDELSHLAHHDSLTDLPNRRLFLDRLDQGIKRAERNNTQLAIFFIDLDNFKISNDTYGHDFGDEVLREVGCRLLGVVRQSDTVARLGGDEFVLIAENVRDATEITAIARKILACFDTPIQALGRTLAASASVGIGVYPQDGKDMVELMKSADQAMYRAKAEGRNGFYSLSGPTGRVPQSLLFPAELRMALKREQLQLLFQPIVELTSQRVLGCEALLRWTHHARGVVSPMDFIPMSEEAGLTAEIGVWAINQACYQLDQWRIQGVAMDFVSLNIAGSQILDTLFAEQVVAALNKYDLPPTSLMFEVAERIVHAHQPEVLDFISRMHALGVPCAIDDFGSITMSYSYIKDMKVDTVKVYQHLLAPVHSGKEDLSLLRAVVSVASVLGKKVVAVGVETQIQEETVRQVGCDFAQGYLYARPMSAAAVGSFFVAGPVNMNRSNS